MLCASYNIRSMMLIVNYENTIDKYIRENVLFRMDKYITMKYFGQIHKWYTYYIWTNT